MNNRDRLIFSLLFGSGLRISECLRLRIKDFDFSRRALTVHSGRCCHHADLYPCDRPAFCGH
ncbi:tyrosine-type recombinase/integrase [Oceanobacter antarcticus]|uniref:Tyrosine-type recombinase/integrase n=1 Tax=Oceanobacter antarcticus TaxID=3133425 RepID=A0ABW8NFW5_9GAMM